MQEILEKIASDEKESSELFLNRLGARGWELIHQNVIDGAMVFKRTK